MSDPTITSRPPSLDELFPDPLARTPTNRKSALGVWEETQKVMAGMPTGNLFTRVAYLEGQQGLDPANIDRLIRHEVSNDYQSRTDLPGWRPNWLDQTGDIIGPLAANVAFLAGNPDYAGQNPDTLLKQLGTGWRPVPAPNVPAQTPANQFGSGVMNGLHRTGADLYNAGAVVTQLPGFGNRAAGLHAQALAQERAAAAYPAPGPDASLLERAPWMLGSMVGKWGPAVAVGGAPALARGVLGPVARGVLAALGEGAYAGATAAGRAHGGQLGQGVPPHIAANRALEIGAIVAGAGAMTPQLPAGTFGPGMAGQVGTMGVNEGVRGVVESSTEQYLKSRFGLSNP
ncbi:MAG: hypothetical protein HZA24_11955 [Nitrospirae bacterium]|nr:hypothetical protein [Nitrospirota bacterium]